jgi:hypothetical protein
MVDYEALYQTGKDVARGIKKIKKIPTCTKGILKFYIDYSGIIGRGAYTKEEAVCAGLGGAAEGAVYGVYLGIGVSVLLRNLFLAPLIIVGSGVSVGTIRALHGLYEFNKKAKAKSKKSITQA